MDMTKINYLEKTESGAILVKKPFFKDNRGSFFTPWNEDLSKEICEAEGLPGLKFVQDNESVSSKGTIRGLHFQKGAYSQAKLVRVSRGAVIDFIVDLRLTSKTFGQLEKFYLDEENKHMLFVPRGFAHGFISLADNTTFQYKVDNAYAPKEEAGINLSEWISCLEGTEAEDLLGSLVLSEKDKHWPTLAEAREAGLCYI